MGDRRKLQEIERCLKKVTEGVETFEDIWQKVHNATNTNQKEKYEADLKKEIKKLQRLRDQIKTWMASSEIKDKRILLENRKLIETQMERFKVVERETKTKAYSKEGLGAAQKLDPAQKEKDEITNWLANSIESLNIQLDQFECEMESLSVALKKKKNDKEKLDRSDELKGWLEKHRYHIKQLETLMRMLDNSTVDVDQLKKIKDDVEYYIECSQEPDFEENEFLYDDLELEDMQEYMTKGDDESSVRSNTPTSTNSSSPIPSPNLTNHINSKPSEETVVQPVKPIPIKAQPMEPTQGQNHKGFSPGVMRNDSNSSESSICSSPPLNHNSHFTTILPAPPTTPYAIAASVVQNNASEKAHNFNERSKPMTNCIDAPSLSSSTSEDSHTAINSCAITFSTASIDECTVPTSTSQMQSHMSSPSSVSNSSVQYSPSSTSNDNVIKIPCASTSVPCTSSPVTLYSAAASNSVHGFPPQNCPPATSNVIRSNMSQPSVNYMLMNGPSSPKVSNNHLYNLSISLMNEESSNSLKMMPDQGVLNSSLENHISDTPSPTNDRGYSQMYEAHVPMLLGVAPLGPVPLNKENYQQLQILEACHRHVPLPSDSERTRQYLPRTPCLTPSYYPQGLPYCDTAEFFQRLSTETLFFIFYYMEGTKAQYLAAKALKKQSWRFHTKYVMWFQRHEEPEAITDEFEKGTYIYFDYEKWGQRKKERFIFEYCYLEDRDLN